jgi:putative membrane protein
MKKMVMWAAVTIAFSASPLAQSTPQNPKPEQDATQGRDASKPASTHADQAKVPTDPDQRFVYETYGNGLAEIQLGKFAAQKAASNEVKQFGQRLVTDHSKANDELKSIASAKNIMLPAAVDAKHQAAYDRLSKLSGPAFDHAFMQDMVAAHRNAVKNFQDTSKNGKDAEVKAFAAKTLPTIEAHLKQAERVHTAVGTSGTSSVPKANTEDDDRPRR